MRGSAKARSKKTKTKRGSDDVDDEDDEDYRDSEDEDESDSDQEPAGPIGVHWVVPPTWLNKAATRFTGYYGNEYAEDCVYGDANLFIRISRADDPARIG